MNISDLTAGISSYDGKPAAAKILPSPDLAGEDHPSTALGALWSPPAPTHHQQHWRNPQMDPNSPEVSSKESSVHTGQLRQGHHQNLPDNAAPASLPAAARGQWEGKSPLPSPAPVFQVNQKEPA